LKKKSSPMKAVVLYLRKCFNEIIFLL